MVEYLARGKYEAIIAVCRKKLTDFVCAQIERIPRRKGLDETDMSIAVRFLGDADFLADEGPDFNNSE